MLPLMTATKEGLTTVIAADERSCNAHRVIVAIQRMARLVWREETDVNFVWVVIFDGVFAIDLFK